MLALIIALVVIGILGYFAWCWMVGTAVGGLAAQARQAKKQSRR